MTSEAPIHVDAELCTACGWCVSGCPLGAIRLEGDVAAIEPGRCNGCLGCLAVCPETALSADVPPRPTDVASCEGVWAVVEFDEGRPQDVSLEILCEGRRLADVQGTTLSAVVIGAEPEPSRELLARHGADRIFEAAHEPLARFDSDLWTSLVTGLIRQHKPEIVLIAATNRGRELAARVAVRLGTGLTADCTALDIDDDGNLVQMRPTFGGRLMATILCENHRPQMATVRPGMLKKRRLPGARRPEVIAVPFEPPARPPRVRPIEYREIRRRVRPLEGAQVIVSGGIGTGGEPGFAVLRELATALGGALGASRGAVERGWMPHEHQVGQTGRSVVPRLYVACGISGQLQHLIGIQGVERVIAINTDPSAPIFRVADVGIVGDLFEVVPKIAELLKEAGTASAGNDPQANHPERRHACLDRAR